MCRDTDVPNLADLFHNSKTIFNYDRGSGRTIVRQDPNPSACRSTWRLGTLLVLLAPRIVARREVRALL
jgi:hypothetical protein